MSIYVPYRSCKGLSDRIDFLTGICRAPFHLLIHVLLSAQLSKSPPDGKVRFLDMYILGEVKGCLS